MIRRLFMIIGIATTKQKKNTDVGFHDRYQIFEVPNFSILELLDTHECHPMPRLLVDDIPHISDNL